MFKIHSVKPLQTTQVSLSLPSGTPGKEVVVDAYMLESCTIAIETMINVQQFLRYMKIEQFWPQIRSAIYEVAGYPEPTFHQGQRYENAARFVTVVMQWAQQMMEPEERGVAGVRLMHFTQTLYRLETQVSANNLYNHLRAGEDARIQQLQGLYPDWDHTTWVKGADENKEQWLAQRADTDLYVQTE